jgi:hypothetical protein
MRPIGRDRHLFYILAGYARPALRRAYITLSQNPQNKAFFHFFATFSLLGLLEEAPQPDTGWHLSPQNRQFSRFLRKNQFQNRLVL